MFKRLRLTSFRWSVAIACAFFLCTAVLFGLVYWEATVFLTERFDSIIIKRAEVVATLPPDQWAGAVERRVDEDPGHLLSAGLFSQEGRRIAGNVAELPSGVTADDGATSVTIIRIDPDGHHTQLVRAVVRKLSQNEWLFIGRNIQENEEIAQIIGRGLALGLLPALGLAILSGRCSASARGSASES